MKPRKKSTPAKRKGELTPVNSARPVRMYRAASNQPRKKTPAPVPANPLLEIVRNFLARAVEVLRSVRIRQNRRRLQLVERLALGNKHAVVLLRVDDKELLVGCCGDSLVLLQGQPPARLASVLPGAEQIAMSFQETIQ